MKRIIITVGGKYHPFEEVGKYLSEKLKEEYDVLLLNNTDFLNSEELFNFNALVFYTQGGFLHQTQEKNLIKFVKEGGGFVGIHSANASFKENEGYIKLIGSRFIKHGEPCEFEIIIKKNHFITQGIKPFKVFDEFYISEKVDFKEEDVLFSGYLEGKEHPLGYVKKYGKGRIFYFSPGHGMETFLNPNFMEIIRRGIRWVCGE